MKGQTFIIHGVLTNDISSLTKQYYTSINPTEILSNPLVVANNFNTGFMQIFYHSHQFLLENRDYTTQEKQNIENIFSFDEFRLSTITASPYYSIKDCYVEPSNVDTVLTNRFGEGILTKKLNDLLIYGGNQPDGVSYNYNQVDKHCTINTPYVNLLNCKINTFLKSPHNMYGSSLDSILYNKTMLFDITDKVREHKANYPTHNIEYVLLPTIRNNPNSNEFSRYIYHYLKIDKDKVADDYSICMFVSFIHVQYIFQCSNSYLTNYLNRRFDDGYSNWVGHTSQLELMNSAITGDYSITPYLKHTITGDVSNNNVLTQLLPKEDYFFGGDPKLKSVFRDDGKFYMPFPFIPVRYSVINKYIDYVGYNSSYSNGDLIFISMTEKEFRDFAVKTSLFMPYYSNTSSGRLIVDNDIRLDLINNRFKYLSIDDFNEYKTRNNATTLYGLFPLLKSKGILSDRLYDDNGDMIYTVFMGYRLYELIDLNKNGQVVVERSSRDPIYLINSYVDIRKKHLINNGHFIYPYDINICDYTTNTSINYYIGNENNKKYYNTVARIMFAFTPEFVIPNNMVETCDSLNNIPNIKFYTANNIIRNVIYYDPDLQPPMKTYYNSTSNTRPLTMFNINMNNTNYKLFNNTNDDKDYDYIVVYSNSIITEGVGCHRIMPIVTNDNKNLYSQELSKATYFRFKYENKDFVRVPHSNPNYTNYLTVYIQTIVDGGYSYNKITYKVVTPDNEYVTHETLQLMNSLLIYDKVNDRFDNMNPNNMYKIDQISNGGQLQSYIYERKNYDIIKPVSTKMVEKDKLKYRLTNRLSDNYKHIIFAKGLSYSTNIYCYARV